MKIRYLALLLIALVLFTSCQTTGNGDVTTDSDTEPEISESETVIETLPPEEHLKLIENGKTQFKLVRPDNATDAQLNAVMNFKSTFKTKTGISLDFVYESDKNAENDDFEIVIGKCLHPESTKIYKDIKLDEYFYGVVGNKIVIAAGSDSGLNKAINGFMIDVVGKSLSEDKSTLNVFVSQNYYHKVQYPLDDFKIGTVSLRDFSIVYNSDGLYSEELMAIKLKHIFQNQTGYIFDIYKDTSKEAKNTTHKIVIGKTAFSPNVNLSGFEYSIDIKAGNIYLASVSLEGYDAMYDTIVSNVVGTGENGLGATFSYKGKALVDETTSKLKGTNTSDVRIMFNNILGNCNDTTHPVVHRTKSVSEMLASYHPDVLGLQECSPKSRNTNIVAILGRYGYKEVSANATNSSKNNYTPLFYNPKTVKVIDYGYDYYSGSYNDGGSKSLTWAVFEVIATGKRFAAASTHFFYQSEAGAGRVENAKTIAARCKAIYDKYQIPVIMGGDLNTKLGSQPISHLTSSGLIDIRANATEWSKIKGHHSYPEFSTVLGYYDVYYSPNSSYGDSIDHAFCYGNDTVTFDRYHVVTEPFALMSSDHCPIIVDFTFNK